MTTTAGQMEVFIGALTEEETYRLLGLAWDYCTEENQERFLKKVEAD